MGAGRVGNDQRVLSFLVREEVEDPLVLHQPAHEVEVRLVVLDAVGPGRVRLRQLELDVRDRMQREDFLEHVGHRLLLEDAVVPRPGEEPQPRADGRVVGVVPALLLSLRHAVDQAVEVPDSAVGLFERQRYALAEQVVEVYFAVRAHQHELVSNRRLISSVPRMVRTSRTSLSSGVVISINRLMRCLET